MMEFKFAKFLAPEIKIIFCCLIVFAFSALMTWVARLYAIHKAILDIPNERSSHQIPTPRAGGLGIILTFILSLVWLGWFNLLDQKLVVALFGGGLAVAAIGFCDDVYHVKPRWRILVHILAALWAVYWIGGFSSVDIGEWHFPLHWLGAFLAVFAIVWCINFYNFMDGIDGLAGTEGIFVSLVSGLFLWGSGHFLLAILMWFLAAANAGFIVWNWSPAKIFLGDAGSGFLGFVFGTIGLYTANQGFLEIAFWWILLAVFLCDATFTLLKRICQGKRWYSAHREHAYQDLISQGANHRQVTLGVQAINCCILLPMAYLAYRVPFLSIWLVGMSTVILALIWLWIKFPDGKLLKE